MHFWVNVSFKVLSDTTGTTGLSAFHWSEQPAQWKPCCAWKANKTAQTPVNRTLYKYMKYKNCVFTIHVKTCTDVTQTNTWSPWWSLTKRLQVVESQRHCSSLWCLLPALQRSLDSPLSVSGEPYLRARGRRGDYSNSNVKRSWECSHKEYEQMNR